MTSTKFIISTSASPMEKGFESLHSSNSRPKYKWGLLKKGPGGLMNACKWPSLFTYATSTIYSHSDFIPHFENWSKTLSPFFATLASTAIAGIVSSIGTLSSSDLRSKVKMTYRLRQVVFKPKPFTLQKQLKNTRRISHRNKIRSKLKSKHHPRLQHKGAQ